MGQTPVEAQGLGHLLADGEDRIQGGHGFLEDHGDVVAPDLAHPGLGAPAQVFPLKADRAGHLGRGSLEEPQDGQRGDGLAAAGLPHQAQGLAGGQVETHPGHGPDPAPLPGEGYREIAHFQQRGGVRPDRQIICLITHTGLRLKQLGQHVSQ